MQVDDLLDEVRKVAAKGFRTLVTTLTKRMAEDLTEYMHEQGIRVRYMHSDIDTIERIEILRDLRLGAFDVLVGINLLREGLDIPECGLVAILDADKEGFLRSETSLIQTIGRAARNAEGRVIMYADRVTGSMERALAETNRRREKQVAYNEAHGITPATVKKNVEDILAGLYKGDVDMNRVTAKVDKPMHGANLEAHLDGLRVQMRKAAENLEFEEAARLRDEIKRLEAVDLVLSDDPLARQSAVEQAVEGSGVKAGRSTAGRAGTRGGKRAEGVNALSHVELEELFERIQANYLDQFEIAIAKQGERDIVLEPALRTASGEIATEGRLHLPIRVDFVILSPVDRSPISSVDIEVASRLEFAEKRFSHEGTAITVRPFAWDWIAIRSDMRIDAADQVVQAWFADAFEEREGLAPPFFSCAHFVSEPAIVDGMCEFQLDAGSCPPDIVIALLDQMIGAGAGKVRMG